jgi:hypothetical protein
MVSCCQGVVPVPLRSCARTVKEEGRSKVTPSWMGERELLLMLLTWERWRYMRESDFTGEREKKE